MPWHVGADTGSNKEFKFVLLPPALPRPHSPHKRGLTGVCVDRYKYHPGGDARNTAKHAPSAMHSVIIQKLNLPKV